VRAGKEKKGMSFMKIKNLECHGVIYKIENLIIGKVYIGKTTRGFKNRYNNNVYKNTHNEELKLDIGKYGWDKFDITEILDIAFSHEELNEKEQYWINKYKDNIYNIDLLTCNLNSCIYNRNIDNPNIKFKKVICIEDEKIFDNYWKCASYYGLNRIEVKKCCDGKRKKIKLYHNNIIYHFQYI